MRDPRILSRAAQRKISLALFLVPAFYGLMLLITAACFAVAGAMGYFAVRLFLHTHALVLIWILPVPIIAMLWSAFILLQATVMSFRKPSIFVPAIWINLDREVDVARFLTALCADMRVPVPNNVILHVGTTFSMGRYPTTVLNANPRGFILCLSLPLLSVLTVNELRTIVAHELAHFGGGDLKYKRRVVPVYTAINETIRIMCLIDRDRRKGYFAHLFLQIPIFILCLFGRRYRQLDLSLARELESRADAFSAAVCGRESFVSALRKSTGYGIAFDKVLEQLLDEHRKSKQPLSTAYRTFRKRLKEYQPIAQEALTTEMVEYSDIWDQHPSMIKRIEAIPPYPERYSDHAPALSLFKQYAGYESIAHRFMENEYRIYLDQTR